MTNTNTAINTTDTIDPGYADFMESMDAFTRPTFDGSLESSFIEAARIRDNYKRWLINKILTAKFEDDTSFLESELDRLQCADDDGLNIWGTRAELGDLEYGIVQDENLLDIMADAHDTGYTEQEFQADAGPSLCWVNEHTFVSKDDAQRFVNNTREAFRKKGDHSAEIIQCRINTDDDGNLLGDEPFIAVVLEADGNWGHRKALAAERDRHMANALRRIEASTTRQELTNHVRILKRYSRDMQVINNGKLTDGNRRCGIGFNYVRFARCMNAVADRAAELNVSGFRSYTINEYESSRKPADGDMMDVGCAQGEFLALEVEEETGPSLWDLKEGTWKPSPDCKARLDAAGPTGFVSRSWDEIRSDADAGFCFTSCGSLAA